MCDTDYIYGGEDTQKISEGDRLNETITDLVYDIEELNEDKSPLRGELALMNKQGKWREADQLEADLAEIDEVIEDKQRQLEQARARLAALD